MQYIYRSQGGGDPALHQFYFLNWPDIYLIGMSVGRLGAVHKLCYSYKGYQMWNAEDRYNGYN